MIHKIPIIALSSLLLFSPPAWSMAKRPPAPSETSAPPTVELKPLTLAECYEWALKQSETVAIQKEDIKEAEAQFFKAASEALGDVDFVMTDSRQEELRSGEGGSVAGSFTDPARRERKFVITQPLFQGFKALGALTGAGSLRKEQKEEWVRAKQLLFLDVSRAFYSLLREKKDLETLDEIYSLFQERVRELEAREKIGRSRTSEVVTAKAKIRVLEAERARIQGASRVAQHLLEFLIGMELEGCELIEEELPTENPEPLAHYLESGGERPDVEAARQSVKTAWRGVIVTQSSLWPEVTLEHNRYDRREGLQAEIDWDLLFKIDMPLFRGGENVGKLKEAVSRWKKEKWAYSLTRRAARLEIQENYQNWTASLNEWKAFEEAVRASEENFRLQKDEYEHNLVSNLDVLQALESLHEVRRDGNHAHYQMKENYWALEVAAGRDFKPVSPSEGTPL